MTLEINVIRTIVRDLGVTAIHVPESDKFTFKHGRRNQKVPEKVMVGTGLELQARFKKLINHKDRSPEQRVKFLFRTPTKKPNNKMRVVIGVMFV